MVKTYIPAPDFSTAPPPKGPVDLGHILKNLTELAPLNRRSRIQIAADDILPPDEKRDFRATREELLSCNLGVLARFLGVFGVGFDANNTYAMGSEDILTVERLETIAFNPTDEYVRESMQALPVKIYLEDSEYKAPVYMITGLKIARGAALESKTSKTAVTQLKIGFRIAAEVGPVVGVSRGTAAGISFGGSSDFVVALRVRRVKYRGPKIVHGLHMKGATMMDGDEGGTSNFEVLGLGDDATVEDFDSFSKLITLQDTASAGSEEVFWIVPQECGPAAEHSLPVS
jgi:hypothetical protein